MSDTNNGTPGNPFDEVPSWYDVPDLPPEQLDPNIVPPSPHGPSAAPAEPYQQSAGSSSKNAFPLILGVGALLVVGGVGVFLLAGGSGSAEIAIGDCAEPVEAQSPLGVAMASAGCGDSVLGEVLAEFEAGGLVEMPAAQDLFWDEAAERCLELIGAEQFAAIDGAMFPFGLPTAQTNEEWAAGDTTIMCTVITEERFDRFTEGVLS